MLDIQYISDYIEIRTLNARYNRFADNEDSEGFKNLFTPDGEFDVVGIRTLRGHAELATAFLVHVVNVHITTDPEIEIEGDTARQRVRIIAAYRTEDRSRNELLFTGWYRDELVRTAEGWRIRRRICENDLAIEKIKEKIDVLA